MTAPHIYTLTGNLLAERTLEFAQWQPGKTHRATSESFQVGGKGINVSKMLNRLGAANTALCFVGGAAGAECEQWLRTRDFAFHAFPNDRPTRTGTVVRAANHPETTFLGADVPPQAAALRACAAFLDSLPDGQVLAICGSLPGWAGADFDVLRAALERWLQRGILIADTYGPPLSWFAGRPTALVKINATEFDSLVPESAPLPAPLTKTLKESPVQRWVISDGAKTVWFGEREGVAHSLTPPSVREVSATGSGDVMLACILHSLFLKHANLRQAVADALPLAAANAAHPGVAEFP
jgi:fructose-1-phosphate kinase PfkB-like protein